MIDFWISTLYVRCSAKDRQALLSILYCLYLGIWHTFWRDVTDFWISTLHIKCATKSGQTAREKKCPRKKMPQKKIFTLHIKCTTKGRQTAIIAAHLHLKHKVQSGFNFDTLFFFIRQAHYFSANYWFLVFQNDSSPVRQESPKNLLQDRWLPRLPLDQCTFDLFFFGVFNCWN